MSFASKSVRGGGSWRLNLLTAVLLLASVKCSSGCNVVLSGPNGTFSSENYPSNYPEKYTICTWDLAVDQGQRIRLVFTDFELEDPKDGQCEFDRVEITDTFSKQVQILGSFCGNQLPPPLLGSGNTLRVTFTSDQSKSFRGFSANYFQTGPCERNSSLCEHLCRSQGIDTYYCGCREGYRLNVDNRTCTEFFLYGPTAGDNVLPFENSAVTYVTLETGIPIQDKLQQDIFISSNGLISFGTEQRFPLLSANKSLLAVYACDIDNTDEVGGVFYHVYNATADTQLLGKASSEVRKFADLEEFSASFVVVVTWDHVKQRLSWNQTSWNINEGEATFQAVLITDGFSSFALVYYFDGAMTWRRSWPEILIGVSDGQGRVEQSMYSGTEYAYLIDGVETNTGTRGTWIYKLGQVKNNPQQACQSWYLRNLPLKQQREEAFRALPQCPCSLKQDVWMELIDDWLISRNDSGVMCYRPGLSQSRPSYPTAKECCYYNEPSESATYKQLVLDPPNAGAALAFNPVFEELKEQHVLEDRKGHEACCVLSGRLNYCNLFYSLRPAGSCLGTFPTTPSLLWGDPHLVTFDDQTFTFNGWGEFILVTLDSPSASFSLQCRTSLAETDRGLEPRSVNATVFTAFGARENNASVFVSLDPKTRESLVIYGNERDYSLQFQNDKKFREENEDFLLQRRGSNLTIRFSSGIRLRVSVQMKALVFSANIPSKFRNMTKGLLGNFNSDVEDDFTSPDGTVLSSNLTERQIFESFGSKWAVTRDNTVMRYDVGESANSYSFPDFRPIFLDEALPSEKIETIALWGDSSPQCAYDYFATGSYAFASATCETERKADMEREQSNNSVPTISVSGPAPVMVGQVVSVQVQVIDPDGQMIVFKLVDNQDTNVTLDPNTGNVTFLLKSTQQKSVRVFAEDPLKAQSPIVTVPVLICSGCSGQGDCDYNNVLPAADERHFPIARCVCYPAFVGDECQNERDACADQPCRPGQVCRDLSAAEQGSNGIGYNCSECPEGLRYDSATMDCIDIDECVEEGVNKCQGSCRNTAGSYACACPPGYRLRADDGRTCQDINECAERTDNCLQICRNTVGAFECACEDGYYSVNDTSSSGGCAQNSTSAATCSSYDCQQGCRPVTDATGVARAQCFCFSGYRLSPADNKTCLDVDECQAGICSQACQKTASGGFLCSCYTGFQLADDRITCVPCQAMRFGDNCSQVCTCSGRGKGCDPVRGCVCQEGWRGSQCEADVNECQETPEICGREAACVNTLGSYKCTCRDGYITDDDGNCKDVDECAEDSGLNTCRGTLQMCTNVPGSFYCTCFPGYRLGENGCTDVDECADNRGSCQQKCVNLFGSYNCECHYGYKLNPDRKTCYKVKDMCKEIWNLNCAHWCQQNSTGGGSCSCNIGYELGEDRRTCTDVNECERNLANCSDSCTNTEGGFICSCPRGTVLDVDGKTCAACPRGTFGSNCSQLCDCGPGANVCDVSTGCTCAPGWMGKTCDTDINECETDTVLLECRNRYAACRNTQGSYRCQCSAGYTENKTGICTDVDECASNPCDQTCENSLGSYRCLCKKGFSFDTGKNRCTDIDECASPVTNLCSQYCENTIGSYLCACTAAGYELADDRVSCRETAACERKDCDILHGGCERRNETETCFCNLGYTWDVNKTSCVLKEVDWCRESKCEQLCNESKEETTFACGCADGFLLNEDGRSCRECPQGTYGPQCTFVCPCETQTTALCNVTTANCVCAPGWRGDRCEVDVNECEDASSLSVCPAHSVCANTPGSFICLCQEGYYKSSHNTCSTCWAWSFGENCEDSCSCNVRNSEFCNHVNGTCTCRAGWRGATCEEDVNECQLGFCSGEGELCENKEGTYVCSCKEGFTSRPDGKCVEFLSIEFQLIVETDVAADLSDSSLVAYQLLKENLREAIFKVLNQSVKGVIAVHVIALRRGSLIVDVEAVVAKETKSQTASELSLALLDIVRRGLTVGGQTVRCSVKIDGIRVDSNSTVCLTYLAINVCADGQTCEEEDGAPLCRPASPDGGPTALSLGLGIGLALFLLTAGVLTVLACGVRHRKMSRRWDRESYQERRSLPPERIRMSFSQY